LKGQAATETKRQKKEINTRAMKYITALLLALLVATGT